MSRARDLANTISGSGTFSVDAIPALPTSKITSGTFADARIPDLATSKITSGTFADARLSSSSVTQHVDLSNLNADNLTSGTIASARLSLGASDIPNLSANKITSDSLSADRIPDLPTSKITSGTFADGRLSSSSVTQHVDLSNLSASNLTSGTIPNARYGTPTFSGANLTNIPSGMSQSQVNTGSFNNTTTNGANEVTANTSIGTAPSWAKGGIVSINFTADEDMDVIWIKTFSGTGVSAISKTCNNVDNNWRESTKMRGTDTSFFALSSGGNSVTMTVGFRKTIFGGERSSPARDPKYTVMWIG